MAIVSAQQVGAAYDVLATGERAQIAEHWAEDMRWLVPGNHRLAGWWEGLDGFLEFMEQVGKLSGGSFVMTRTAVLLAEDRSADVSHNVGELTGATGTSPYERLEIDVVHLLRWRNGRVVEGKGAIFGDGTTRFDQYWSQVRQDGTRV